MILLMCCIRTVCCTGLMCYTGVICCAGLQIVPGDNTLQRDSKLHWEKQTDAGHARGTDPDVVVPSTATAHLLTYILSLTHTSVAAAAVYQPPACLLATQTTRLPVSLTTLHPFSYPPVCQTVLTLQRQPKHLLYQTPTYLSALILVRHHSVCLSAYQPLLSLIICERQGLYAVCPVILLPVNQSPPCCQLFLLSTFQSIC